ncbi:hypothetical protein CKO45_25935 [Paracraurococcus ruber]|uniref:Diguanylate cyclase n=1 Tax=Paracraurococcus ruber TaxID=77675 RepID=A0ABS1D523_9PROT|nr:hypothetical protein [Paracraurococcus ruber]
MLLATLLPPTAALFALIGIGASERLADAERDVGRLAALRAEQQTALLGKTQLMLAALARQPALRALPLDPAACAMAAQAARADTPWLRGIAVTDGAGVITCSNNNSGLGVSLADRAYLQQAITTRRPVVSPLLASRVDAVAQIIVALPLDNDHDGAVDLLLLGVVDIARLLDASSGIPLGTDTMRLFDGAGRLVASLPPAPDQVGQGFADHPFWRSVLAQGGTGVHHGPGLSGEERIKGFARIEGTDAVVAVGRSEAAVMAPVAALIRNAALLALAGLGLAILVAWVFGRAILVRDIGRLAEAARRWQPGGPAVFPAAAPGRFAATELQALHAALAAMEACHATVLHRVEEKRRLLDIVTGSMAQGLAAWDADWRLTLANPAYARMLGLPEDMGRPGRSFIEIARALAERGFFGPGDPAMLAAMRLRQVAQDRPETREVVRPDGRVLEVADRMLPNGGMVTTFTDVTERREAEARTIHMARHDALTGLPNRTQMQERLADLLAEAGPQGRRFALLYLDLDRFKWVNDTLGHQAGDALLVAVADRIRNRTRTRRDGGDLVVRLGGDEFVVVTAPVLGLDRDAAEEAAGLAARLITALSDPVEIEGQQVVVGASVGIALFPAHGMDARRLLQHADLALYRAKEDGRGCWRFFEPEMDEQAQQRRRLEMDLRRALAEAPEEFVLHYQPAVEIAGGRVTGFEALLRWQHPERGLVAPQEFIGLAEEIGAIEALGELVLRRACAEAARWPDQRLRLAVNLSALQFRREHLTALIHAVLEESGLDPRRLELEITEGVLLNQTAQTMATLRGLRDAGVRIAMDDFGTGYSSLSYLRSFPFDRVKIDRAFVRDLASRPCDATIVRAVTTICAGLGMATTAEGVETEEQLRLLAALDCNEAQGFLFGRPVPAAQIPQTLARLAALAG